MSESRTVHQTLGLALCVLIGCGGNVDLGGLVDGGTAGTPSAQGSAGSGGAGSLGSGGSPGAGGTGAGGTGAGGTADVGDAGRNIADGGAGNPLKGLEGSWKGYVENFQFDDQSDAVLVAITGAGSGQITFGNSPPPPPATDPNVGYPPGVKFMGVGASLPFTGPYPGFAFTLTHGTFDGQRLQFDVGTNELWKHWCEQQTPILDEINGGYFCVHNWGGSVGSAECSQQDPKTMMNVPIDCGKLALCSPIGGICQCTAQACSANENATLHFDMMMATPKADGSVRGLDSSLHNVHLTKQ